MHCIQTITAVLVLVLVLPQDGLQVQCLTGDLEKQSQSSELSTQNLEPHLCKRQQKVLHDCQKNQIFLQS